MAKKTFKAQDLRSLLGVLMVLIVLGGVGLFYMGLGMVRDYSVTVTHRLEDADASVQQIDQLQLLRNQLSESESLVNKADRLFATPGNYQSRTLTDLKNYAAKTGLEIGSTSYQHSSQTGLYTVTLSLGQTTVNYGKLIQFLSLIEGNLPKMQVASIQLDRASTGNPDDVEVGTIKINVSVR